MKDFFKNNFFDLILILFIFLILFLLIYKSTKNTFIFQKLWNFFRYMVTLFILLVWLFIGIKFFYDISHTFTNIIEKHEVSEVITNVAPSLDLKSYEQFLKTKCNHFDKVVKAISVEAYSQAFNEEGVLKRDNIKASDFYFNSLYDKTKKNYPDLLGFDFNFSDKGSFNRYQQACQQIDSLFRSPGATYKKEFYDLLIKHKSAPLRKVWEQHIEAKNNLQEFYDSKNKI